MITYPRDRRPRLRRAPPRLPLPLRPPLLRHHRRLLLPLPLDLPLRYVVRHLLPLHFLPSAPF